MRRIWVLVLVVAGLVMLLFLLLLHPKHRTDVSPWKSGPDSTIRVPQIYIQ